ncbi:hypothetical protein BLNAU_836 [Blattamonas nauphoetae]|uniref:Uncharacterized protein n=1 Tax=Blattamonas nauphoetae TaxID=2049346 RepID=A0ABQ9YKL9_9EUKA|nr:hypothetical protein BLNAU_836 [Blattamonas nauphoetae]
MIPLRVAECRCEGQAITVEQIGKDLGGCGEGCWICCGLARAGKNVGGSQPCTITVVESSFLNGVMVNSPDGGQAPILTLSHLSFSLPPVLDTDSLIESLGDEVTVKDCLLSNEAATNSETLCSWESGLVVLNECVCEISWTKFRNLGQGAIHATNSNVTLSQSDLTHNGLPTADFPSAWQNIRCVGRGKISFESFST